MLKKRPLERSRVGRVERFSRTGGTGCDSFRFWLAAIELAHDIGANAPERLLVGLGFLAFAVCALVSGADEAALDEHVRFLIVVATRSAKSGRNTTTRCHSVFELHSSSAFFQERCVATDSTVNF